MFDQPEMGVRPRGLQFTTEPSAKRAMGPQAAMTFVKAGGTEAPPTDKREPLAVRAMPCPYPGPEMATIFEKPGRMLFGAPDQDNMALLFKSRNGGVIPAMAAIPVARGTTFGGSGPPI
jgi:hypothetical protein